MTNWNNNKMTPDYNIQEGKNKWNCVLIYIYIGYYKLDTTLPSPPPSHNPNAK